MNIIDDMEAIRKRLAELEKAKLSADEMASLDETRIPPLEPVTAIKPELLGGLTFPELPPGWHPPMVLYCDNGEIVDLTPLFVEPL